jgi:hypothetical protein
VHSSHCPGYNAKQLISMDQNPPAFFTIWGVNHENWIGWTWTSEQKLAEKQNPATRRRGILWHATVTNCNELSCQMLQVMSWRDQMCNRENNTDIS